MTTFRFDPRYATAPQDSILRGLNMAVLISRLPRIIRGRCAGAIFAMAASENRDGSERDLSSGFRPGSEISANKSRQRPTGVGFGVKNPWLMILSGLSQFSLTAMAKITPTHLPQTSMGEAYHSDARSA